MSACVFVCVCVHAPDLSLKFHKLKVVLEIIALSARNRIIQSQRSLCSAN